MQHRSLSRAQSFALCTLAYVVAFAAAAATAALVPLDHPLAVAAAADLVATAVVFGFSVAFDNSSFYDAYWSVAPPILGAYFLAFAPEDVNAPRQVLALGLCTAWAVRLTYNWARGWTGLGHEDWRYVDLRAKTGKLYWLVSGLGIHLFPTVQVFAASLALFPALTSTAPLGALDGAAALVTALAIACEAVADSQLRAFVQRPGKPEGSVLREGLWALSRHPNYFGEMSFWWGLCLFGLAAAPESWRWLVVGPSLITLMFFFVSVPLMEKRQLERKPAFRDHVETTSMIVPWFPKRRAR
jgi:steroid 5-alpha reductase family enzyme